MTNWKRWSGFRIPLDILAEGLPLMWEDPVGESTYSHPALFLRGGNSGYVPDSAIPAIKQLFKDVRIETIADAGHWYLLSIILGFMLRNQQSFWILCVGF